MFISHDYKFIFIAVPKTASSTMNIIFNHLKHPEPDEHHMGINEVLGKFPECKDYFKFAFVRNPWDRLLSGYCDFVQNRKKQWSEKVKYDKELLSEYNDFNDFCIQFPSSKWATDVHLKPQYLFLTENNQLKVDFVGKFENLKIDFDHICQQINYKYNKKTLDTKYRKTNHQNYKEYYTEESKQIIGDYFKKDIELFNYEF